MDCGDVRSRIPELHRARLDQAERAVVVEHLQGCPECRRLDDAEALLDRLLEAHLPRQQAPAALRRRLEAMVVRGSGAAPVERPARSWWPTVSRWLAPAVAAGLTVALGVVVVGQRASEGAMARSRLTAEAVNDHLRVLAGAHPLGIESGGQHQVKPWFQGRLDFAPAVPAAEGAGLELLGGSVGYFLDRKAAVLSYRLRAHRVTLLALRAGDLAWPADDLALGTVRGSIAAQRGFHVVTWRTGELGYALVSDVNGSELLQVAAALAPATAP